MKRAAVAFVLACLFATAAVNAAQTPQPSLASVVNAQCGAELTRMQTALPASRPWAQFKADLDSGLSNVQRAFRDDPGLMQATLKDDAASLRQTMAQASGSDRRAAAASALKLCVVGAAQRFFAGSSAPAAVGPPRGVDLDAVLTRVLAAADGPPPLIPPSSATPDERAADILNACGAETRTEHAALIRKRFMFQPDATTGTVEGDAARSLTISAQLGSTKNRADALASWETFYWLRPTDDAFSLFLRCMAKRRVEQIDGKEQSDRVSLAVMRQLLQASGALGSGRSSPASSALVTLPLAGSNLDARVEDIAHACSVEIIAIFSARDQRESRSALGDSQRPEDWMWYLTAGVSFLADSSRADAAKSAAIYSPYAGGSTYNALEACLYLRRIQQLDTGVLRILPRR